MKSIFKIFGLLLIGLSTSCTSSRNSSAKGYEPNDRYFSLADAKRERKQNQKLNTQPEIDYNSNQDANNKNNIDGYNNPETSTQNPNITDNYSYTPAPQTNNGANNSNYYNNDLDDNYDFQYASRFRRFNNNWGNMGYYSPYMTNIYWYNNDPFMFGNSIYSTCNFFNPYTPWGWNSFGGGPGLNFGWNSWSGFYMNYGMGYNNPWAWNNPWRWNNWGYSPYYSPFAYNPWGYNPYGFGMNPYSIGYSNGLANGLMMNQMMNNQMYFNSLDNNSLQPIISTPVGVNVGGGSVFKMAQPTLAEQFTKEIPNQLNPLVGGGKNQLNSNTTGKNINTSTAPQVSQPSINSIVTKPTNVKEVINTQPVNSSATNNLLGKDGKPTQSISSEQIKGSDIIQNKPSTISSQLNKNDLIQGGAIQNNTNQTKNPINNYTSAPSGRINQEGNSIRNYQGNENLPLNKSETNVNSYTRPERNQELLNNTYTPNSSPEREVNGNIRSNNLPQQSPSRPAETRQYNNYQQYQSPQIYNQENRDIQQNNYQQYRNQQPQQRNDYSQPRQQNQESQQRNDYSQPRQQYQIPQQRNDYSQPRQQYQEPQHRNDYSQPRQQYQEPQQRNDYSQPRQQYQEPQQRNNYSQPRQEYQAPRQNNISPNRSFESAPRNYSGGGSFNSGGYRMNSPRR
jgi:hypothetical protein